MSDTTSALDTAPLEDPVRWDSYTAPRQMVEHAQRQLKLVHDIEYISELHAAAIADWGRDPFGGAWNSWDIGFRAWEVGSKMIRPREVWEVYVCGEA